MNKIDEVLNKIKKIFEESKDTLINEKILIDLEYLFNKYNNKINPKYTDIIIKDKITILFYKSGINVLIREDFNEKELWDITKIIISNNSFSCIKLRKNKDFTNTSLCTSKQLNKIKLWFSNNLVDYETLSLFYIVKDFKNTKEEIKEILDK